MFLKFIDILVYTSSAFLLLNSIPLYKYTTVYPITWSLKEKVANVF